MPSRHDQPLRYATDGSGSSDGVARILMASGFLMIVIGLGFGLYVISMVYTLFNDPTKIPILNTLLESLKLSDQVFSGTVDGKIIDIKYSESARQIIFIVLAILSFSILTNIVHMFVTAGKSLMNYSKKRGQHSSPAEQDAS